MKAAVAASSVLLVLLCGSAARAEAPAKPASTKDLIVGHWYEDMRQNGVRTISIAHNYPDGSYTARFFGQSGGTKTYLVVAAGSEAAALAVSKPIRS